VNRYSYERRPAGCGSVPNKSEALQNAGHRPVSVMLTESGPVLSQLATVCIIMQAFNKETQLIVRIIQPAQSNGIECKPGCCKTARNERQDAGRKNFGKKGGKEILPRERIL
jgi:hypothetical protein